MDEKVWGKQVLTDNQILELLKTKSQHYIRKTFHVGATRINRLAKGLKSKTNSRPRKTTPEEDNFIRMHVRVNPTISIEEVIIDFQNKFGKKISQDTIIRRLKETGFSWRAPRTQQILTADHVAMRRQIF